MDGSSKPTPKPRRKRPEVYNAAKPPIPRPRPKTIVKKPIPVPVSRSGSSVHDMQLCEQDLEVDLSKIDIEDVNAVEEHLMSSLIANGVKTQLEISESGEKEQILAYETWKPLIDIFIQQIKQDREHFREKYSKWRERALKIKSDKEEQLKKLSLERKEEKEKFECEIQSKTAQIFKYEDELVKLKRLLDFQKDTEQKYRYKLRQSSKKIADLKKMVSECDAEKNYLRARNDELQAKNNELQLLNNECLKAKSSHDELVSYLIPQLPKFGEQKGSGAYGSVHYIQLNGTICIAKCLHDILLGKGKEEQVKLEDKQSAHHKFRNECVLLSRMRHPNIVQFMGVHYGPQRDYGRELTLVMECLYINLEECLGKYPELEMWCKMSILLDVSKGLLHLHSHSIIHRDLTAPNILLTTSFHAKIADLGVSKIIDVHPLAATKQSMIPGALGYMPPEALCEIPIYTFALDIFSFGIVTLYVLIQTFPQFYDSAVTPAGLHRKESHIEKPMKWIKKLQRDDPIRLFICQCLQDDPDKRPIIEDINKKMTYFSQKVYCRPFKDIVDLKSSRFVI